MTVLPHLDRNTLLSARALKCFDARPKCFGARCDVNCFSPPAQYPLYQRLACFSFDYARARRGSWAVSGTDIVYRVMLSA
eukprot:148760-Rhodomonas_salina.1